MDELHLLFPAQPACGLVREPTLKNATTPGSRNVGNNTQLPLHASVPDEQTTQAEGSPALHHTLRQESFERYQKRKADNTIRRQKIDLALFEAFLAEMGTPLQNLFSYPEAWKPITFPLVEHFLEWQLQKGYAIDSINIRLTTVKKYAALACQVGVLSSDELFRIREVKGFRRVEGRRIDARRLVTRVGAKKATPTFLTEEQLKLLFQVPDLALPQGWRDLLLLRLLYDLGLRPGEVISLQIADVDLQQERLHVRRHKTDGEQFLRPTAGILAAAIPYLQLRRDPDPLAPLLVRTLKSGQLVELVQGPEGSIVTPPLLLRGIHGRVHQLGLAIGVNLSAYDGRHQWTRDAVDAGNALIDVLSAGGWSKDSPMVRRYSEERTIANERITLNR